MLKLYLVRHGESAWNQRRVYTGQQDVPLSELGQRQAAQLAEHLAETPLAEIYASPLKRANDTVQPLAKLKHQNITLDARLAEIHHGAWEGNSASEVRTQYAAEYLAWRTQPHRVQMPEGESLEDVAQRVQSFLRDVLAAYADGNILIATHDAVLRVIVLQTMLMGLEYFWRWRFDNAALTIVERMPDGHFRLALLNDGHHLEGVQSNCEHHAL
ncbi:MAG: alpha-ribazole phosphatase [Chloroflexi bacterium]|nr:alpha-ribazole phosphatase [Chloroflexota bacterium]